MSSGISYGDPSATLPTGAATAANQTTEITNQTAVQQTVGSTKYNRSISTNAAGIMSGSPTYRATIVGYTGYATPTDLFGISGSASKIIVITMLQAATAATVSTLATFSWIKRSTLNTGGTSAAASGFSTDSADAAATAIVSSWSVIPGALGTAVGTVATHVMLMASATIAKIATSVYGQATAGNAPPPVVAKPIILRNANEGVYCNFGGAALPAGFNLDIIVEWMEITAP